MRASSKVILASSSPWRRKMLHDAGVECQSVAPEVDESAFHASNPVELAMLLARKKAAAVFRRFPDCLVIGADQVAHIDGEAFGKPVDDEDHLNRLRSLCGREHQLSTGVCVLSPKTETTFSVTTGVCFRADIEDYELRAYVASREGSGCAGGYQIEGRGAWFIESLKGDWFNGIGLPVLHVVEVLREQGWRIGDAMGPVLAIPGSEG